MADWRQIQARIRKAKNSPDAHAKLSELFQRTRDAMVAWELAAIEEKAGRNDEAGKWYTIAAQRFRRAEWKTKAEEALTRLGIALPVAAAAAGTETAAEPGAEPFPATEARFGEEQPTLALGEIPETQEEADPAEAFAGAGGQPAGLAEMTAAGMKKRRRGRRGGRGRRRKGAPAASSLPTRAFAEPAESRAQRPPVLRPTPIEPPSFREFRDTPEPSRPAPFEPPAPQLPSERAAHGRAGDPALASRMARLESMLRRLVAGPLHRLDESDEAPAGPGVFLLSDSDLITSYYIEACQTLRVGLGNLARGGGRGGGKGGRGSRSESGLKANLADHLGISEAKVSQYLKEHCVVRWIQLDDEAPHLAHFAIGVLRTPLNVD